MKLNKVVSLFLLCLVLLLIPGLALCQTAPALQATETFSLNADAIALPGGSSTTAGTLIGGTLRITPNFSLRQTNILAPGANFSGNFGGFEYQLPMLSTRLNNASPNLNGMSFRFYLTGSLGVERISPAVGPSQQHWGWTAGGGVKYDPSASGHFSIRLFEIQYADLPGLSHKTYFVSGGPNLRF